MMEKNLVNIFWLYFIYICRLHVPEKYRIQLAQIAFGEL